MTTTAMWTAADHVHAIADGFSVPFCSASRDRVGRQSRTSGGNVVPRRAVVGATLGGARSMRVVTPARADPRNPRR
jgi:hypothetical protein